MALQTCTDPQHWRGSSLACCHGSKVPLLPAFLDTEGSPSFARELPARHGPVPSSLRQYLDDFLSHGGEVASAKLCKDEIEAAPESIAHVISGQRDMVLRLRAAETHTFITQLFRTIEAASDSVLAPWDLYHGHMFLYMPCGDASEAVPCELAMLFHAKEFPREYRMTKFGATYPVGHPAMGGERDPRVGSQCSVQDASFPLRNYLWLMSRNTVYQLQPQDPAFPEEALSDKEFWTVDQGALASRNCCVLDVNYFPWLAADGCELLICPRAGFPPSLRLYNALKNQPGDADSRHVIQQLVNSLDRAQLSQLSPLAEDPPCGHPALHHHVCPKVRKEVRWAVQERISALDGVRTKHNEKELQRMRDSGVAEEEAVEMLRRTQSHDGTYSSFRAENLLQVLRPNHRTVQQLERFGCEPPDSDCAQKVWEVAFYADSTLEALALMQASPDLTAKAAAQRVVSEKEAQTRATFALQQQEMQAARQAAASEESGAKL